MLRAIGLHLVTLMGPDGRQPIELNPAEIVTMRAPRAREHFAGGAHCLISTADGKLVVVHETCEEVRALIGSSQP